MKKNKKKVTLDLEILELEAKIAPKRDAGNAGLTECQVLPDTSGYAQGAEC